VPLKRTSSRRGDQTRDQILVAARQLFTERGYHQTSVYDLFEQAGITKGAFFHHWKTKEELALAVLEDAKESFEAYFFRAPRPVRPGDRLAHSFRQLTKLSLDPAWPYGRILALWCAEMRSDEGRIGPAVHALRLRWVEFWKEIIEPAQREHALRTDISAENLSLFVVCSVCGVLMVSGRTSTESTRAALETLGKAVLNVT
jgi:TetR/AcrR family transcriptional repressor of nem operon